MWNIEITGNGNTIFRASPIHSRARHWQIVTKTSYSQFGHIPIARCSITSWRSFSWPFKYRGIPTYGGYLGTTRSHRQRRWLRLSRIDALMKNGYRDEAGGKTNRISGKTRRKRKNTRDNIIIILFGTKKKKNVETKNQKKSCPDTEGITILFAFLSNFSDAIDTCAAEPLKNLFL